MDIFDFVKGKSYNNPISRIDLCNACFMSDRKMREKIEHDGRIGTIGTTGGYFEIVDLCGLEIATAESKSRIKALAEKIERQEKAFEERNQPRFERYTGTDVYNIINFRG